MGIDDFEYPILPDRVYTIKTDLVAYRVYGSRLIEAYLALIIPPDITQDTDESPS